MEIAILRSPLSELREALPMVTAEPVMPVAVTKKGARAPPFPTVLGDLV
jgi:hypothetical protein